MLNPLSFLSVARSEAKAAPLKKRYGDKVEVVIFEDFSTADISGALKGTFSARCYNMNLN